MVSSPWIWHRNSEGQVTDKRHDSGAQTIYFWFIFIQKNQNSATRDGSCWYRLFFSLWAGEHREVNEPHTDLQTQRKSGTGCEGAWAVPRRTVLKAQPLGEDNRLLFPGYCWATSAVELSTELELFSWLYRIITKEMDRLNKPVSEQETENVNFFTISVWCGP